MKTAIYVLYQKSEFDKFACFFAQFSNSLSPTLQLYVLINDSDCTKLRELVAHSPHVSIYCENINLGVARGRNYLIERARTAGAEFLISCDSDIIFPTDYVPRLRASYMELQNRDPNLGFVQPVLLNGPDVVECFPAFLVDNWAAAARAIRNGRVQLKDFWSIVRDKLGVERGLKAVFHTGVCNIWQAHFDAPVSRKDGVSVDGRISLGTFATQHVSLRDDRVKLLAFLSKGEPVRVMSVAGGVTAFHVDVLNRCGPYNEIFNPFGFEDSELGTRSTLNGLNNYLLTDLVAIHDIFLGNNNRTPMAHARIGVLRGAEIAGSPLSRPETDYALGLSLVGSLPKLIERFLLAKTGQGTQQERESQLPSFLLSYYFELVRGLLDGVRRNATGIMLNPLPVFELLRGFVTCPTTVRDFVLPLGGAVLQADRADAKLAFGEKGRPIYALSCVNCRIEEEQDSIRLQSRYFDIYARLRPSENGLYELTFDVQSDDVMHTGTLVLAYHPEVAARDGVLSLVSSRIFSKKYDYGCFSVEDIYPTPTLFKSTGWLPLIVNDIEGVRKRIADQGVQSFLDALKRYLTFKPIDAAGNGSQDPDLHPLNVPPLNSSQLLPTAPIRSDSLRKKRVLIFTDSRGQYKPAGSTYDIFSERLAKDPRLDVDLYMCPMKWTTTLDFLEQFPPKILNLYDHVILFTGIVEWSPRPANSAQADLYDNHSLANMENLGRNTSEYSKKIVNNKKAMYDRIFGSEAMAAHFSRPFDTEYEGDKTINMYGLEMARERLIPALAAIPNLIFVTANRIVPGWEGDFKRGRPKNIAIIEDYSKLFATELTRAGVPVVDLLSWSTDEVRKYTCDNMHLTKQGSEYIYEILIKLMGMEQQELRIQTANRLFRDGDISAALEMYLALYDKRPLQMYAFNAMMAARKLGMGSFSSIDEFRPWLSA